MKYLDDAYLYAFNTKITAIEKINEYWKICLEETYFYPEGGGQPCDQGFIDRFKILKVEMHDQTIWHFTSDPLGAEWIGKNVECKIDEQRRMTLMQQHTGQHLLSAIAKNKFDASTVGFHIGEGYVTIDLDVKLSELQIQQMEVEAQRIITANLSILAHYPTADELKNMPLRKQPKVSEGIRVIEINSLDFSPCGGTHVNSTQEILLIKILFFENYKSGVRLTFVCGNWAIERFRVQNTTLRNMMQMLSSQESEVENAVSQLFNQVKALKRDLHIEKEKNIEFSVQNIFSDFKGIEGIKVVKCTELNMDISDFRLKANKICAVDDYIFFGNLKIDNKQQILLSKSDNLTSAISMNTLFKTYFTPLGAKGGGSEKTAQGGIDDNVSIDEIFNKIENEFISHL